MRVFGCLPFVFNPEVIRSKWDKTSSPCMFIGYTRRTKIMRFLDSAKNRVITSAHAKFYEKECGWEGSFSEEDLEDFFTDLTDASHTDETTDANNAPNTAEEPIRNTQMSEDITLTNDTNDGDTFQTPQEIPHASGSEYLCLHHL